MSFLKSFFNRRRSKSVVLVDVSANSVAGAYVRYTEGEQPILIYSRCLPVEVRRNEPSEQAMLRALKILGDDLLHEGAPLLVRTVGEGSIQTILVSIDAPWQKTEARTEHFEQKTPFIFNEHMVQAALQKNNVVPSGYMLANESIIGTTLNGYETDAPYKKEAHRASISILMSYVDEHVAKDIHTALRSLYHTKEINFLTGNSLRYQALRTAFPHERDMLIVDALGPSTSIALVRGGLLAEITEIAGAAGFAQLAERFPLPHTIFLLAHESEIALKKEVLDTTDFGKLWLSDTPPKIISVLGSHLSGLVKQTTTLPPDLSLLLMSLYFKQ